MKTISTFLPILPPSINKLYTVSQFRTIIPTSIAKKFKNRALAILTKDLLLDIGTLDNNKPHHIGFIFHLPILYNKSWPKSKNRFKRQDITNLIKLLEDILMSVLCIDDSSIVASSFRKIESTTPGVFITIMELDE